MLSNAELLEGSSQDQIRRGNLAGSIEKRAICLRAFARWLGDRSLLNVTKDDVDRFLDERNIVTNTRYAWISHLHCFYVWAINEGLTEANPTIKIVRPKMRRHLPRPAATAEIASALAVASPLFRCWLTLGVFQGLRCQEIAGLERQDVDEARGLIRVVHGKGAKERLLPLHPEVAQALLELPMPRSGRIFLRPRGGPFSPGQLSQSFNRELANHGVDATAHQLRHWFATEVYGQTHDILLTGSLLGHSSPQTTAIYAAFNSASALESINGLNLEGAA